jgi:hypothetical protein
MFPLESSDFRNYVVTRGMFVGATGRESVEGAGERGKAEKEQLESVPSWTS